MNLEEIKILSNDDIELFQTLRGGYIRSLSLEELINLFKESLHSEHIEKILHAMLCYDDFKNHADHLLDYLLKEYVQLTSYKEKRRVVYLANRLFAHCSTSNAQKFWEICITSNKRSFRKYAYQVPATLLTQEQLEEAWSIASKNGDEINFIAKTIVNTLAEDKLHHWQSQIVDNNDIEEYIQRKFFIRKLPLNDKDWLLLKENLPKTYIYVAAIRNKRIKDEEAASIYQTEMEIKEPVLKMNHETFSYYEGKPDYDGLLLWCFARMQKGALIKNILRKMDTNENPV